MGFKFNPITCNLDLAGSGGGSGVGSINTFTGDITIAAGSGITVTPSGGDTLTIAATGGSGANTALSNLASVAINQELTFGPGTPGTVQAVNTDVLLYAAYGGDDFIPGKKVTITTSDTGGAFAHTGRIDLTTGKADGAANSGAINLTTGRANTGSGGGPYTSGDITLQTGGTNASANTGDIALITGTPLGSGTRGKIQFVNGSEGTAGYVWTSTDTAGNGEWAAAGGGGLTNPLTTDLDFDGWAANNVSDLTSDTGAELNIFGDTFLDLRAGTQRVTIHTDNAPTGNSGIIEMYTGEASDTGASSGDIYVAVGNSDGNTGGIYLGDDGIESANGNGGNTFVYASSAAATSSGIGGNIILKSGDALGGGVGGDVQIATGNAIGALKGKIRFLAAANFLRVDESERDSLAAEASDVIYNTDADVPQYYDGTAWADMSGGGIGTVTATTSAVKTPTGSGNFNAMSCSVNLVAGKRYQVWGSANFAESGSAAYTSWAVGIYNADGSDSGSLPSTLDTNTDIVIQSAGHAQNQTYLTSAVAGAITTPTMIIQCTNNTTVYLVTYATMTVASNARITGYLNAMEI